MIHEVGVEIGGKTISFSTGELAKQADGSILCSMGETSVLATAVADKKPSADRDFFPLSVEYKEKYYGKKTDRAFATINFNKNFSEEQQIKIINQFNEDLENYREKYYDMFLTNFRNSTKIMARKRISFTLAYIIISNVIFKLFPDK